MQIISWIIGIVSYTVLDAIWLGVIMKSFYLRMFGDIARTKNNGFDIQYIPAFITYTIMAFGVTYFVIPHATSATNAALRGALLGLVMYGVYDFTNHATLKQWTWTLSLTDLAWGIIATAITSAIVYSLK